jgi:hypothetical protein
MLMPNLIYYCSFQLKEVEMVFLAILFIPTVLHHPEYTVADISAQRDRDSAAAPFLHLFKKHRLDGFIR